MRSIVFTTLACTFLLFNNCSNTEFAPGADPVVELASQSETPAANTPPPQISRPTVISIEADFVIEARNSNGQLIDVSFLLNGDRASLTGDIEQSRRQGFICSAWLTSPVYKPAQVIRSGQVHRICNEGMGLSIEPILPAGRHFVRWELPTEYRPISSGRSLLYSFDSSTGKLRYDSNSVIESDDKLLNEAYANTRLILSRKIILIID